MRARAHTPGVGNTVILEETTTHQEKRRSIRITLYWFAVTLPSKLDPKHAPTWHNTAIRPFLFGGGFQVAVYATYVLTYLLRIQCRIAERLPPERSRMWSCKANLSGHVRSWRRFSACLFAFFLLFVTYLYLHYKSFRISWSVRSVYSFHLRICALLFKYRPGTCVLMHP